MVLPIKRYFALLRTYLRPQWHRTVLLTIFLVLNIGAQLFNPQVLRYFIDAALTGGTSFSLVFAGLLFVGVAFFNQGISVASSYLSTNIAWTATNRLRTDLLRHCLGLDMGFHKAHTPGEMIERIDGDVDDLSNFFSQFVVSMLTNLVMLIGILVLFFTIHWLAGVALTLFALLVFVLLLLLRRPAVHLWRAEREMSSTFYGFLGERLGGTENIRANGATAYTMRRFYLLVRQWFPIRKRAVVYSNLAFALTLFLFICGSALALAIGMYLWSLHLVSVGTVYVMYSYTNLLTQPLQQIQTQLQDLQQAEACIGRIEELLGLSSALRDGNKQLPARSDGTSRPQPLPVQFRDVTFGYVVEEPVLQHLSFAIEPGHVLGVLGRTGSGKTTLVRLLFRLYDPQAGEIQLGDVPLPELQLRELRRHIGMVTQDVQLFHASVRDNLTLFRRDLSDADILSAMKEVGLDAWYRSLPEGLDTILGSDGEGLSAGEAQLLAFTRVLLLNPGLVILDEASSRLDPATEHLIERAIERLFAGRTAIVIAHRLATVQRVDELLILGDGQILEYGKREVLESDPTSRFSALLRTGLEGVTA